MPNKMIKVEVAYALPDRQSLIALEVEEGATIEDAIQQSGILEKYPEIDLSKNDVGIFSKKKKLQDVLGPNDRVEIYRPLIADPKEARRKRAEKQQNKSD